MSSRNSETDIQALLRDWRAVAKIIDHTLLRPEATADQAVRLCEEAREFGFGAVIVNAVYVELAVSKLQGSGAQVGVVIGFPFGATLTSVKVFEANETL